MLSVLEALDVPQAPLVASRHDYRAKRAIRTALPAVRHPDYRATRANTPSASLPAVPAVTLLECREMEARTCHAMKARTQAVIPIGFLIEKSLSVGTHPRM